MEEYDILTAEDAPDVSEYNATKVSDEAAQTIYEASVRRNESSDGFGVKFDAQKIILDSKAAMSIYVTLSEGENISDYTFTLTYIEGGEIKTAELKPWAEGDRYRMDITNIPVAYWDYMYNVHVTKNDDTSGGYCDITCSVLSWARICIDTYTDLGEGASDKQKSLMALAKAMFLFNDAANKYFGK